MSFHGIRASSNSATSIMSPDIPNTAGIFRPLKVIIPEGTIVNPRFPGAVGAMGVSGYRLADTWPRL